MHPIQSLPIVQRELLVLSRKSSTYWGRAWFGLSLCALLMWMIAILTQTQPTAMVGRQVFMALLGILFVSALFSGVKTASDCLCVEKREGTLGFLFLTDLSGWDVVMGKLAAVGLTVFYTMLAACPVIAVISLMGGIGLMEIALSAFFLLNTLFLSLSVGLLASTLFKTERTCASATTLILLALCFYPMLIAALAYLVFGHSSDEPPWPYLTPWFPIYKVGGMMGRYKAIELLTSLACTQALAWSCLAYSAWKLPRSWQEFSSVKEATPRKRRGSPPPSTFESRSPALELNPTFWLALRNNTEKRTLWTFLCAAAGLWCYGLLKFGTSWLNPGAYAGTALTLHLIFKFWMASEAGALVHRDRASGALELILGTPHSIRELIRGQHLAIWKQCRWPLTVLLLVDATFIIDGATKTQVEGGEFGIWIFFSLVYVATLLSDLHALSWLSMWTSLKAAKMNQGSGNALALIVFLPSGILIAFMSLLGLLGAFVEFESLKYLVAPLWPAFCLFWNYCFYKGARHRLLQQMHAKAAERAVESTPFLQAAWNWLRKTIFPTA